MTNIEFLEDQLKNTIRTIVTASQSKYFIGKEKYGNEWLDCDIEFLNKRLKEEVDEFINHNSYEEAGGISDVY